MKTLRDYTLQRGPSLPLRIFKEDKARFDDLQKRIVVAMGGIPISQAQVVKLLLDTAENVESILNPK